MQPLLSNPSKSWPILAFLGLFLLQLFFLLSLNNGQFIYTLDDPYIHLRLAENLMNGHYGINPLEYSAPSSSILWPFLLAPSSGFSFGQYIPLVFNLGATVGTLLLMSWQFKISLNSEFQAAILGTMLVPGLNLIGMTFTGMEHSLQIFFAVMVVSGLIVERETGHTKWWLILALIVGPLIRYEALALTITASTYLTYRGRVKVASSCLLISLLLIGTFSWFLSSMNLELLPNSVIAKSQTLNTEAMLPGIAFTFLNNLLTRQGTVILAILLLFGFFLLLAEEPSQKKWLVILTMSILLIHLSFIPVGGNRFYRYDIYIFAIAILVLVYTFGSYISQMSLPCSRLSLSIISITTLATISFPFVGQALVVPLGSNNIYEQQYQMKRFFQQYYRKPIAVNDLGLVSYGANNYVLDLWGLGSHEALTARRKNSSGEWMDRLARKHKVNLAMIYEQWFPSIPEKWTRIATLHLRGKRITPGDETVAFYSINQENIISTQLALQSFKHSLPFGVRLELEFDQPISDARLRPSPEMEGL